MLAGVDAKPYRAARGLCAQLRCYESEELVAIIQAE